MNKKITRNEKHDGRSQLKLMTDLVEAERKFKDLLILNLMKLNNYNQKKQFKIILIKLNLKLILLINKELQLLKKLQ